MKFDVFFDYTCGYAYRAHRWLDALGFEGRWRPFALLEANRDDGETPVWEQERHRENISLLLLAGHEVVRRADGDVDTYRAEAFHAWHETDRRLDVDDVVALALDAGVTTDAAGIRGALEEVGAEHRSGAERGVFGSPTIVFDDDEAAYVQLAAVPSEGDASAVWETVREVSRTTSLLEIKRPVAPRRGNRRNLLTGAG